ncbi:MAG: sugar O-acetyltransferase [Clostridia bacterium]|nr:sugar O-acetyltransferase [Clostridia bacterium]
MNNPARRDAELLYIADGAVMEEMKRARRLTQEINTMDRSDLEGIARKVAELLGKSEGAFINPPFYCDYGTHIEMGRNCFMNYNCCILDVAKVVIGDNLQCGPNVSIYTAGHPVHPEIRDTALEYGIGVTIGSSVWIGGNTVILPGVTIGDGAVIGAGSVVTRDIPAMTVAAGNPCRVLRKITDEDRAYYFRGRPVDGEALEVIREKTGRA